MIFKGFTFPLLCYCIVTLLISWVIFRFFQSRSSIAPTRLTKKLLLFLIITLCCWHGGASSSLGDPANPGDFAFSKSHLVNQLCLNTTYNLVYEYFSQKNAEKDPIKFYGNMDTQEMLDRVRKTAGIPKESCTNPNIPLLHNQQSHSKKRNRSM